MSTGTSPLPPPPRSSPPPPRPSPSPPPPPPPVPSPSNNNHEKVILIGVVAIAVGGAVVICCMLVLLVYLLRKSNKDQPRTSRAQKKRRASYLSGEDVGTQPPPNAPATTPTARGGGGGGDSLRLASLHDVEQGGWPISPQHVALSPANSVSRTRGTDSLNKTRTEISDGNDGGGAGDRPSRASTNRFSRLASRLGTGGGAAGGGEVDPRVASSHDAGGSLNQSESWAANVAQRQYSTGGMISPPGGAAAAPDSPNVAQLLHHRQQGSASGMLSSANSTRWRRSRFGRSAEVSQQHPQSPNPAGDGGRATGSGPVRLALGHSDSEEDNSYTGVGVGQAHSYPVGHENRSMATIASVSKPTSPSGAGENGRSSPRMPLRRPRIDHKSDEPVMMMNNPAYKPNWRSNVEEGKADALEAQDNDATRRISAVTSLNGPASGASGRVAMARPRSGAQSRAHATHSGMLAGDGGIRRAGTLSGVVGATDGDLRAGTMSRLLSSQLEHADGSVGSTNSARRLTVGGTAAMPGRHLTQLHAAPSVENVLALERSLPGSPRRASLVLPDSAFSQAPVYTGAGGGEEPGGWKSTA